MNAQEKAIAWKYIQEALDKIVDPVLKQSMFGELYSRAEKMWGYCPTEEKPSNKIELKDWEQSFLEEIKVAQTYGTMIVDEQESIKRDRANKHWMMEFIRWGGDLDDLPEEIRSDYVRRLYFDCLLEYGTEIDEQMKHLLC